MTLRDCPLGLDVVVRGVDLEPGHRLRLREMGLRVGVRVRVAQRGAFGGRVVAVAGGRFALDGGTAGAIVVEPAAGPVGAADPARSGAAS